MMYALLTLVRDTCYRLENIRFRQFKSSDGLTITSQKEAILVDRKLSKSVEEPFSFAVSSYDTQSVEKLGLE